ncbi:hypothetical protein Scep_029342 [Stephania cephalantha]|uniref:Uncharacterized protein n=1 Tax=Stephania cephalantha TaxID=152367 RepID=A0AAP0DXJ1_9MAGN
MRALLNRTRSIVRPWHVAPGSCVRWPRCCRVLPAPLPPRHHRRLAGVAAASPASLPPRQRRCWSVVALLEVLPLLVPDLPQPPAARFLASAAAAARRRRGELRRPRRCWSYCWSPSAPLLAGRRVHNRLAAVGTAVHGWPAPSPPTLPDLRVCLSLFADFSALSLADLSFSLSLSLTPLSFSLPSPQRLSLNISLFLNLPHLKE